MSAPTLARVGTAVGAAARRHVLAKGAGPVTIAVYKFASGTSAVTAAGEDISDIWDHFDSVLAIIPSQVTATIANRREFSVDLTNKLLLLYKAVNTVDDTADPSAVTDDVRLVVYGIR